MNKRKTITSFRDIDPSGFRNSRDAENAAGKASGAAERKHLRPVENVRDEAALFLDAVSGAIDVSLKNTPAEKKSPPLKNTQPPVSGIPAAKPASPQNLPEDDRLFYNAMDGVSPVRSRGRDLAPPSGPAPRAREFAPQSMDEIFAGGLEFSLEYTDEFLQGHVTGLDSAVLGKLRAGSFSAEGHLDLHGQNLEQAYSALAAFIKHAYQSGKRHLLVITGRGKNSPGGTPILRERVQAWFTRDPFKRVVLAFCSAKPSDGGAGALYLLLRKRKKTQGKVVWDRRPSEEELLL